jgi:hypothetical protein
MQRYTSVFISVGECKLMTHFVVRISYSLRPQRLSGSPH